MSTIISGYKNKVDMLIKGAPDRILAGCTSYMSFEGTQPLDGTSRENI